MYIYIFPYTPQIVETHLKELLPHVALHQKKDPFVAIAGAMAEHVETSLAGLTVKLLRRATSLAKIYFAPWIP